MRARELIKLKVLLESSPITPREAADQIAAALGADVIQVIGGVIVLYRESPELKEKAAQKEKNKKLAAKKAKEKFYAERSGNRKITVRRAEKRK